MFFLLIAFFIVLLVLLLIQDKQLSRGLFWLVFAYCVALSGILVYITKDYYYNNLIKQYFYFPNLLWRWLFYIQIPKFPLIRLIHISSMLVLLISILFSLQLHPFASAKRETGFKIAIGVYALLTIVLYEPVINIQLYYFLYPSYLSAAEYRLLEGRVNGCTHIINILLIAWGFLWLLLAVKHTPKLKLFQQKFVLMAVSYGTLAFFYAYFISVVPAFFLDVSKVSHTYSFRSIRLGSNYFIYQVLPYILILALIGITYSAIRLARLNKKIDIAELCISKEIDASETTSKIFCHYIKNEVLAITSEIELLTGTPSDAELKEDILKRCGELYERVDEIHHSTKTSYLNLRLFSMQKLLQNVLEHFAFELKTVTVHTEFPQKEIMVLIDPEYMGQALQNVINNSIEAMEANLPGTKMLSVALCIRNNSWIQISISDTGKGIAADELDQVFLPFHSTHTYAKHWGVGLTLTYRIIRAHEGKTSVRSTLRKGTTIEILLPFLRNSNERRKRT